MPSSVVRTFNDPDDYFAAVRSAEVEGVVTESGDYRAELARIGLTRLMLQRGDDSLARVVNVAANSRRIGIHFATERKQSASYFSGIELSPSEIIVAGLGSEHHLRSTATSRWGDLSLTQEDLLAAGHSIVGHELRLPTFGHPIRPLRPFIALA